MPATASSIDISSRLSVAEAYDLSAPFYDSWKWQQFWHEAEYPIVFEAFARFRRSVSRGMSLLDVGCGTGWYLEKLSGLLSEQVGIDLSCGMLALARHRLRAATLVAADARSVGFPSMRFDAILCTRVISHLPDIRPAICEMRRLLRPSGLLVISNVDAAHDYQDTRLPVGAHHIVTETYKHARQLVRDQIERIGFISDKAALINNDGSSHYLRRRRVPSGSGPAVGWVSSWRKAT